MALAFDTAWGNLIYSKILARRDFLAKLNGLFEIPDSAQKGAVTVTLLDAMTATAITDGTMVTNLANQTQVALTLVNYQCNLSLPPKQAESSLTNPENLNAIAQGAADAFGTAAQLAVIAACLAATAGITSTLTVGQIDFTTDGTLGEATDNLRKMTLMVAKCFAAHADLQPSEFAIVMPPTAWAYFTALRAANECNAILGPDGYSYMGVPLFSLDATTFGGAGYPCAYMLNKRNYAFAWAELGLHGGGPIAASDATTKWINTCSFVHGIILDDFIGEILNPAS